MLSTPQPYPTVANNVPAPDDAQIESRMPTVCVDYLSHQWTDEDVWSSWKAMTKQKNQIANGVRLENASWRTWAKQRGNLKTISPETLNWYVCPSSSFSPSLSSPRYFETMLTFHFPCPLLFTKKPTLLQAERQRCDVVVWSAPRARRVRSTSQTCYHRRSLGSRRWSPRPFHPQASHHFRHAHNTRKRHFTQY